MCSAHCGLANSLLLNLAERILFSDVESQVPSHRKKAASSIAVFCCGGRPALVAAFSAPLIYRDSICIQLHNYTCSSHFPGISALGLQGVAAGQVEINLFDCCFISCDSCSSCGTKDICLIF